MTVYAKVTPTRIETLWQAVCTKYVIAEGRSQSEGFPRARLRKGSAHAADPGESRGGRGPNLTIDLWDLLDAWYFCVETNISMLCEDPFCTKCNK